MLHVKLGFAISYYWYGLPDISSLPRGWIRWPSLANVRRLSLACCFHYFVDTLSECFNKTVLPLFIVWRTMRYSLYGHPLYFLPPTSIYWSKTRQTPINVANWDGTLLVSIYLSLCIPLVCIKDTRISCMPKLTRHPWWRSRYCVFFVGGCGCGEKRLASTERKGFQVMSIISAE